MLDYFEYMISGSGLIEVDLFINETKGIVDATGAYQSGTEGSLQIKEFLKRLPAPAAYNCPI